MEYEICATSHWKAPKNTLILLFQEFLHRRIFYSFVSRRDLYKIKQAQFYLYPRPNNCNVDYSPSFKSRTHLSLFFNYQCHFDGPNWSGFSTDIHLICKQSPGKTAPNFVMCKNIVFLPVSIRDFNVRTGQHAKKIQTISTQLKIICIVDRLQCSSHADRHSELFNAVDETLQNIHLLLINQ